MQMKNINYLIEKINNKLIEYRIRKSFNIEGWLSKNEAIELYKISKSLPSSSNVVEIGAWKGKSTFCIAKGLDINSELFVIDPFDTSGDPKSKEIYISLKGELPLLKQFKINLKSDGLLDKIKILEGLSKNYVGYVKDISFLFIDGNHSKDACKLDFEKYSPYVVNGGIIAFHDFDSAREELGPTWVVNNLILKNSSFQFYKLVDSLWICKKLNV